MNHETDERLCRTFASGGKPAMELAIAQYSDRLFYFCYHMLCDYHAAQDALQNAFLLAYRKQTQFRQGSSLYTWLYKIAYRCCLDLIRKRKDTLPLAALREQPAETPAFDAGFSPEILAALGSLSPKERAAIYGRAVEEREYSELAALYHTSEAAMRKRYERAKAKMLQSLSTTLPVERSSQYEYTL